MQSQKLLINISMCNFPTCNRNPEYNGYCLFHKIYSNVSVTKERKPIAKQSEKRKADHKEYLKIVKAMLKENPMCEIKEFGCEWKATGLHHQKKRSPATLLDKRYLKRSCNSCNLWCELHPLEAIEKGHSISKFKK